jgi:hypothetical protein
MCVALLSVFGFQKLLQVIGMTLRWVGLLMLSKHILQTMRNELMWIGIVDFLNCSAYVTTH